MKDRAQALQQNDSIWCILHFFSRCLTNSSCDLQKNDKLNTVAAQDSSYQTLLINYVKVAYAWLPAKQNGGYEKEGVESEKRRV